MSGFYKKLKFTHRRSLEALVFLFFFLGFFIYLGSEMGTANLLNTLMKTSWDLLMNTVFFIMGITVLTGALGKLLIEFGVVRLLEFFLAPLMKPLYNLPGVASLGALMTFLSDNPAIIGLAKEKNFNKYFKPYQIVSLTNFGTAFGMGLVVVTFMASMGYFAAALVGLAGAVVGSIVSTRLMQRASRKLLPEIDDNEVGGDEQQISFRSEGSIFERFLNAILDGGKTGVDLGLAIIPGVLVISSLVMIVTFGPKDAAVGYQGLAYEGVAVLPHIADYFSVVFDWLFGFQHPELIAFPITSLGAVGAALSLVPRFASEGFITGNEIAVFTAIGMCWSGFLSTHTAMLDALGYRKLISKAILAHTVGGLVAGIVAHWLFVLFF
ncbi:CD0519/CD1768 family membrane protein [Williamwhitmania taraxaci]|uniref:Nucleoside recognition n=1 Tax=Williamwhitmania taraxaci TaxID=1640674 RepID=A0A1G6RLR7_9BACT|nr:hypothetical protein [Williamwhitmania taraxaci]SDD04866.1 hypothetical protein SAMN05216323_10765 [Williamwhitmania taraxaci]